MTIMKWFKHANEPQPHEPQTLLPIFFSNANIHLNLSRFTCQIINLYAITDEEFFEFCVVAGTKFGGIGPFFTIEPSVGVSEQIKKWSGKCQLNSKIELSAMVFIRSI